MGCGASKGAPLNAPTALPNPPSSSARNEFDPESKPRQEERSDAQARGVESREAAKRVDNIIKAGASELEDGQEAKPKQSASQRVAAVPALPSPPPTPPAAIQKPQQSAGMASQPMSKHSSRNAGQGTVAASSEDRGASAEDEAAAEDAAAYFPVQVSLNVSGNVSPQPMQQSQAYPTQPPQAYTTQQPQAYTTQQPQAYTTQQPQAHPTQQLQVVRGLRDASPASGARGRAVALSEATTLQPFVPSEPPSLSTSTTTLPLAPSARFPQLPKLQQEDALPSAVQSQAQSASQLEEPAQAAVSPPPASDDPWSSLQSQYRIREHAAEDPVRNSGALSVRSRAGVSRGDVTAPDGGKEVLVLGDDDPFSGGKAMMMASLRSTARGPASLRPSVPGAQPKKGGWGSGQMAQAGELMIGEDDWLESDRPPGVSPLAAQLPAASWQQKGSYGSNADPDPDEEMDPHERLLRAPMAKGRPVDDVQCEDIEDIDALLDDEMEGLSNKSLASKLAAYESKFGKD